MAELEPTEVVTGKVVEPSLPDRAVAFFVALSDDEVDKDWSDFGKAAMVVLPAVVALVATKGRAKGSLKSLIAPGIALGKLVHDVNRQVKPEHLAKAHDYVEQAKTSIAHLATRRPGRAK